MERINATIGYREIDENGNITYHGGYTEQGFAYIDHKAWESGEGVIYIGEYALQDYEEGKIENDELWTRESWIADVVAYFGENDYPLAFYEYFAEVVFKGCDWQELTTLRCEWEDDIDEDFGEWCKESGFYTKEFKSGKTTISRGDLESLPCPFCTKGVSDEKMQELADLTERGTKDRTSDYSSSINKDKTNEIWWEELESCCNYLRIPYYEDME